jgi:hypothetical protein
VLDLDEAPVAASGVTCSPPADVADAGAASTAAPAPAATPLPPRLPRVFMPAIAHMWGGGWGEGVHGWHAALWVLNALLPMAASAPVTCELDACEVMQAAVIQRGSVAGFTQPHAAPLLVITTHQWSPAPRPQPPQLLCRPRPPRRLAACACPCLCAVAQVQGRARRPASGTGVVNGALACIPHVPPPPPRTTHLLHVVRLSLPSDAQP